MKTNGKRKWLAVACPVALGVMLPMAAWAAEGVERFQDIEVDAWYRSAVDFCQAQEWMGGTSWDVFSPDEPVSRSTLAVILHRQAGSPNALTSASYQDVAEDAWYKGAVDWVSEKYFISGYGNGYFGPDDLVTRQQLAVIMWRCAGHPESGASGTAYADQAQIADYAQEAIRWAKETELLGGLENNCFQPNSLATRAQVATVVYRYWDWQNSLTQSAEKDVKEETGATPTETKPDVESDTQDKPKQEQAEQVAPPEEEAKDVSESEQAEQSEQAATQITLVVGEKQYTATLVNNEATKLLLERLPMTLKMNEMNGNEKYIYLPQALVMQSEKPGQIHSGDLMLYGSDCLVLFYKDFTTAYSYTRLGQLDNAEGLASVLGTGPVEVTLQLAK